MAWQYPYTETPVDDGELLFLAVIHDAFDLV